MYRKVSDFITDYEIESSKTISVFNSIPNDLLSSKIDPKGMSLGELFFHIVQAIEKITSHLGFNFAISSLNMDLPKDSKKLLLAYELAVSQLIETLELESDDTILEKTHVVYGTRWTVGHTLSILLRHEIHHRAQIVFGLRILGQSVPDIYGPGRR